MRVAIIGAGIAGLSCAETLRRAGQEIVIFEKSRGIGGRIATRRTPEDLRFDHGAQFFTVQTRAFRQFLAGDAKKWPPAGEFDQTREWYVGTPDIKSFLRPVARNLDIRLSTQISKIEQANGLWTMETEDEEFREFEAVVLTAPAPQTAKLAGFSNIFQSETSKVKMDPCWTLMLAFSEPAEKDFDVKKSKASPTASPIDWMARNSSKWGRRERPDCWVVHGTAQWSRDNLEMARDDVLKALLPFVLPELGKTQDDLLYFSAHRWRYANVAKPVGEPFIVDETGTLLGAGDWCAGTCVEHAFTSGVKAAQYLCKSLE